MTWYIFPRKSSVKILSGYLESIETFSVKCDTSSMFYRYQEYSDGIQNFDDVFLIWLDFSNLLRECLKNNLAISKICAVAEAVLKTKMHSNLILNSI